MTPNPAALTVVLALLLTGCGTTNTQPPAPPATSSAAPPAVSSSPKPETGIPDETRAALIRQTVPSLRDVDTPRLAGLVDGMCRQLTNGVDPKQLFQASLAQHFSEDESFGILSAAVVTTCPSNVSKVTYDTVGWHP